MSNSSEERREYMREYMKTYRADHPEKEREKRNRHYAKIRARRLVDPVFHQKIKDGQRVRSLKNYARHKDRVLARNKAWAKANPDRVRQLSLEGTNRRNAVQRGAEGSHTREEWEALKRRCGHRCACCGEAKKLTKDHIVALINGGSDYIENIQPLCRECNSSKGKRRTVNYMLSEPAHVEFV